MNVYYANEVDYDKIIKKVTPLFSTKQKVIDYLKKHVIPKSRYSKTLDIADEVKVTVVANTYTATITRTVYDCGDIYSQHTFIRSYEIMEEEVL